MNIFKKQVSISENDLFKSNGEFNLSADLANMLDTILIVLCVRKMITVTEINLELRRCGFFISHPELKKVLDKLIKDGLADESFYIGD